jgi:hypothetical protein
MLVAEVAVHFALTGVHLVAELAVVALEVREQPLMEQPTPVVAEAVAGTVMATDQ